MKEIYSKTIRTIDIVSFEVHKCIFDFQMSGNESEESIGFIKDQVRDCLIH